MSGQLTPSGPNTSLSRESKRARMGQIQLIFGPMFSGKSTELIRRMQRLRIARLRCLIVKYANDNRYTDAASIATHSKQMLSAVNAIKLSELKTRFNLADDYDVIGIDEGQFFPDIIEFSESMSNIGKTVIVAALDGTYQRKEFSNILELVPLAEHVIKLTAVCMICFEDASFTKRTTEDKKIEVIGGAEKYMAVCRTCYFADAKSPVSPITQDSDKDEENSSKFANEIGKKRDIRKTSLESNQNTKYLCTRGTEERGSNEYGKLS